MPDTEGRVYVMFIRMEQEADFTTWTQLAKVRPLTWPVLTPALICVTGKNLDVGFGFGHGIDAAQQMNSCCPWVMLKLLVFTEGTGSSRADAWLSGEDKSYDLPGWEPRA